MARYLVNLTNGQLDEKGIYWPLFDLLTQSGVLHAGALQVSAQSTPDMTVRVAGGTTGHSIAFLTSSADMYYGRNTANENVTITANASGVTKTDAVVAYADLAAGITTSNNPGALKFVAVRRSGSNTGNPTAGEISSAVSSNPYVVLAYVTVTNGASSINSGNITDARPRAQVENSNLEPLTSAQYAAQSVGVAALLTGAKVRQRVGGSATDWSATGTTTYDTSGKDIQILVGVATSTTNTTTSINGWFGTTAQTVTFPTAFANSPLVFLTTNSDHAVATVFGNPTTTGFTWRGRANTSVNAAVAIMWIAIGEKA